MFILYFYVYFRLFITIKWDIYILESFKTHRTYCDRATRASESRNISACTISCKSLQIERGSLEDYRCYNLTSSCYYMWNRVRTKVAPDLRVKRLKLFISSCRFTCQVVECLYSCNLQSSLHLQKLKGPCIIHACMV